MGKKKVPADHNAAYTTEATEMTLGPLIPNACISCGASNFAAEMIKVGHKVYFSICCDNGKSFPLPAECSMKAVPPLLRKLMTDDDERSKNFQKHIRQYNSALAFASLIIQKPAHFHAGGPFSFRVQGQVYSMVSAATPDQKLPSYGQLYFIDSEEASAIRSSDRRNEDCDPSLFQELDNMIRIECDNPYAKLYATMKEKFDEEQDAAMRSGRNPANVSLRFFKQNKADMRRFNLPTCKEVAAVFVSGDDGSPPSEYSFIVYDKVSGNALTRIPCYDQNADPMTYPLLFPHGETGFKSNLKSVRAMKLKDNVSQLEYVKCRLAFRPVDGFSLIHWSRSLMQQYVVDSYVRIETSRLNHIRMNQDKLRSSDYQSLTDHISASDGDPQAHGRRVILPSSVTGSPRYMIQNYQDSMAMFRRIGTPDLFITITCNPNWDEITSNLNGLQSSDRPDLVCRVFKLKLKELIRDLTRNGIFGATSGFCYTIEFQKRGLPHAHILLTLQLQDKIRRDELDSVISAEIPDPSVSPLLHSIVARNMIHGPCGPSYPAAKCMKDGKCSKGFPKRFSETTQVSESGYPVYRRRDNGQAVAKQNALLDNRWVVPYNPFLLLKYNCHINVEDCFSIRTVKYLNKYINKGHDCISISLHRDDEVSRFVEARYVSAPEAAWRIFEFQIAEMSHTVFLLALHLENQQTIIYKQGKETAAIEKNQGSTLTAFFELNRLDVSSEDISPAMPATAARHLFYYQIPEFFIFDTVRKSYRSRKIRPPKPVVGRMVTISPLRTELYHMRLLLLFVKGPVSFESLGTVNGELLPTFKAAAARLGLLEDSVIWEDCMEEASATQMPAQLRQLFAIICLYCEVDDKTALFEKYLISMTEDYTHNGDNDNLARAKCLIDIGEHLTAAGSSLEEQGLPHPGDIETTAAEDSEDWSRVSENILNSLNEEQRHIYDSVLSAVNDSSKSSKCFFVDGPGGTGKTYLYKALIYRLKSENKKFIATATTGIASLLIPEGRTAHSTFGIPLSLHESSTSSIKMQSQKASDLREAKLIIVDEVSMLSSHALTVIDRLLRDIMRTSDIPFGGKCVLIAGDFRQVLPVVPRGTKVDILMATIKKNVLWQDFRSFKLTKNIRAESDNTGFQDFLMTIGNGSTINESGLIDLPHDFIVSSHHAVEQFVFGGLNSENIEDYAASAVLTPRNDDCDMINRRILSRLDGELREYRSIDKVIADGENAQELETTIATEFIHTLTPTGMPPHSLHLKPGAIVILLRNLNPRTGLCNGTRLLILQLHNAFFTAKILTGSHSGQMVMIPRIKLIGAETTMPFSISRIQFPVRLAFAMTINKSQGQTLDKVGLFIPNVVFGHGQLYVAFSRVRCAGNIKVFVAPNTTQTQNIVYAEML